MGIRVIQSQRIDVLLETIIRVAHQPRPQPLAVLKPQHFIVPSAAVQTWLTMKLSERQGISANRQFHQRIRAFQWFAYQAVLDDKEKVRKANIPRLILKWRIYQAIKPHIEAAINPLPEQDPLFSIVQRIYDSAQRLQDPIKQQLQKQSMLYWVAEQVGQLFTNYMEYRGYCFKKHEFGQACDCTHNWLNQWGNDQPIDIDKNFFYAAPLFPGLDSQEEQAQQQAMSEFSKAQAQELETWQRYLWKNEFHADFKLMQSIDVDFWQNLEDPNTQAQALKALPEQVVVFTVLDLPPSQLSFLRRLGQYIEVLILHFNPSQEYWADTVDAHWKKQYEVKLKQRFKEKNPDANSEQIEAFFEKYKLEYGQQKDSRHPLLTRFGKQARDHFSLLANLSAGENEEQWHDIFPMDYESHLLGQVQSDILNLAEPVPNSFELNADDDSIQIHVCHSSLRQLEVLKDQLTYWLSQGTAENPRLPQDILVLSPNVKELEPLIRSVFAPPPRAVPRSEHGLAARVESVYLPVKIAGVSQLDTQNAWRALLGPIQLTQGRFSLDEFADWLNLTAVQTYYGLNYDQTQRIIVLLNEAKFKRGLDAEHLKQSLIHDDQDHRYSFKFALDRLVMGIAVPEHCMVQDTLSYAGVRPSDFGLVNILIQIYQDFAERRYWSIEHEMGIERNVEEWLFALLRDVERFEKNGVTALKPVRDALRKHITLVTLAYYSEDDQGQEQVQPALKEMKLPLPYLLQELQATIDQQSDQALPTGEITFSQIGQIRPLPYKLIVMLNLDSGKFPRRQNRVAFDLMSLLRTHLGDRSRLEDDQGAFLDALLLAKENLWLFYNGFDVNDGEVREPSSVLQELIRHLARMVNSRAETELAPLTKLEHANTLEVYENLKSLYQVHTLQPFQVHGFIPSGDSKHIRYQDHWYAVAQHLQDRRSQDHAWSKAAVNLSIPELQMDASQWIKQVTFPAELYLKTLGIENPKPEEHLATDEPLLLDGLEKYAIRDLLQTGIEANADVLFSDQLPVGKLKQATWSVHVEQHEQQMQLVKEITQTDPPQLTAVTQRLVKLSAELHLQVTMPIEATDCWVSVTAASARGRRRAQIWLEYLLWLYSLPETDTGCYTRIEVCKDVVVTCSDVTPAEAREHLQHWMAAWKYGQTQPLVLPAALLLDMESLIDKKDKEHPNEVQWEHDENHNIVLKRMHKLIDKWTNSGEFSSFDIRQDEANQAHLDWAFILRDRDAVACLSLACGMYAHALYAPIYQHLKAE